MAAAVVQLPRGRSLGGVAVVANREAARRLVVSGRGIRQAALRRRARAQAHARARARARALEEARRESASGGDGALVGRRGRLRFSGSSIVLGRELREPRERREGQEGRPALVALVLLLLVLVLFLLCALLLLSLVVSTTSKPPLHGSLATTRHQVLGVSARVCE
ncbi:Os01g0749650 [Oryza sativa Japonica Group]|uniref:Os01g0749650 protein n=1 Tax=Oryza sativa subsp. japonica TaxID=39947 RepID=A0A0P0V859_ORYSJ|nr:Os01g0749650 [Oryza sativa Japonica Group]